MKQTHYFRLLQSVIVVLTLCLLIMGGAYRMQKAQLYHLQRENNRLRDAVKEVEKLSYSGRGVVPSIEDSIQTTESNNFTDSTDLTDHRYGPGPGLELLKKQDKRYIHDREVGQNADAMKPAKSQLETGTILRCLARERRAKGLPPIIFDPTIAGFDPTVP